VVAGYTVDPRADPGVPESFCPIQFLPSSIPELVAFDGIEAVTAELAVVLEELDVLPEELPSTLNVVFTTGHAPLAVHDLKWIVCVPAAMPTLMTSISCAVTPLVSAALLSIENPKAVGVRPSQPTL
jgi:hypothetical protein